jgi:hypothetical protein
MQVYLKKIIFISFLIFFGFFFFHVSYAQAATLFFNNAAGDNDWNTLGNWWTDAGFTLPSPNLPAVSDDVILSQTISVNTGPVPVSVNTITVNGSSQLQFIFITVANGAVFNGSSGNSGSVITGNVTFNDSSTGGGTINGTVIFNNGPNGNGGIINGDAIFNGSSHNDNVITGNVLFNDLSFNNSIIHGIAKYAFATGGVITIPDGGIWGQGTADSNVGIDNALITTWIFNGRSINEGTTAGDTTFNNTSFNGGGTVNGNATFNDSSFNNSGIVNGIAKFTNATGGIMTLAGLGIWGSGIANSNVGIDNVPITAWIFNDSSRNNGTVSGNATFNNRSINFGTVTGDATFNNSSLNVNSQVKGNAVFNDLSVNSGTVVGIAKFTKATGGVMTVADGGIWGTGTAGNTVGADNAPITSWIFNGSSDNEGTITGNATFNDTSFNLGTINGTTVFNGLSHNNSITGNATFNDSSANSSNGSVGGNAAFNDSSSNSGAVSGNACFALNATHTGTVGGSTTACPVILSTVATLTAGSISSFSVLSGSISDTGGESASTVGFNFGLDANYGTTKSSAGTFNRGNFSASIAGLTCATTYHFRAFAINSAGTAHGNDSTFTTGSCSSAPSSTLYGVDGSGQNPNPAHLYILNSGTGTKISPVGLVGGFNVTGMAFHPTTGILYGTTGGKGSHPQSLITIDTSTGVGTLLGTVTDSGNPLIMPDIAFRSDGRLYGSSGNDGNIHRVDISSCNGTTDTTCSAVTVGISGLGASAGNGLAFDRADHLFLFRNGDKSYFQMDPDSGQVISQINFSNPSGLSSALNAAKFDENGILFASRFNSRGSPADLIAVDLSNNNIISTGQNNPDMSFMDAIAFKIPPPSSVVIPVLTTSPASAITQTTATLNGSITDTGGADATERGFNYGLTTAYGSNIAQTSGHFTAVPFSADISNLVCNTTYHFRSYAINSAGTGASSDASFTTIPCTVPVVVSRSSGGGGSSGVFHIPVSNINNECRLGDKFSTVTGLPCVLVTVPTICPAGSIFSTTTGLPCTSFQLNFVNPPSSNIVSPSNPLTTVSNQTHCVITTTLKVGSKGVQVKCLQASLNISADGIFGPKTKAAVIVFQKSRGLVPDGIFGPKSRAQWMKI